MSAATLSASKQAVARAGDGLIVAREIYRSFGRAPALQGASLSVADGEILAISGRGGSGKSTLLHCLAGIFRPDSGEVWFDGQRVDHLGDKRRTQLRRTEFGCIFQFGELIPELSPADNIAIPLLLRRVGRKMAYRFASAWLQRLGLAEVASRPTGELSGGQAQRVALARALVIQPRVLFADEPTGSLDSPAAKKAMDLLVDIAHQDGTTVVLVSRDARVAGYADREVMMTGGKLTSQ